MRDPARQASVRSGVARAGRLEGAASGASSSGLPAAGGVRDVLDAELRALRHALLRRVASGQTIAHEGLLDRSPEDAYRVALALRRRAQRRVAGWPRWAERPRRGVSWRRLGWWVAVVDAVVLVVWGWWVG